MPIDAPPDMLRGVFFDSLAPAARTAVERIVAGCKTADIPVYAVGGTIRDVLLERPIVDVDLAVEGGAASVMRGALPGVRITAHPSFGTASATIEGTRIDLVTARSEAYARPGALPEVTPASIIDDMRRRDFGANAIALRLDQPELIDPCGGIDDLRAHRIRVLHDGSFRADATRIFRAFRYAARLGFAIEPRTRELIDRGVQYVQTIGGERLRRELELMFGDGRPGAALAACAASGAIEAIHKSLRWSSPKSVAFGPHGLRELLRDREIVPFGFALLASDAATRNVAGIVERLRLKHDEAAAVEAIAALRGHRATLERPQAKPSGVVMLLDRYPAPAIAAFVAGNVGSIAGDVALRHLREWRSVKPMLTGRDLQTMGVPEGPQIARGLQLIRAAKLDGWVSDRDDERALALRFIKSIRDSSAMNTPIDFDLDDH